MVSDNVNRIFQAVNALTDEEQAELRKLLEHRSTDVAAQSAKLKNPRRRKLFQPIELPGGPLSDDIIRDRR